MLGNWTFVSEPEQHLITHQKKRRRKIKKEEGGRRKEEKRDGRIQGVIMPPILARVEHTPRPVDLTDVGYTSGV